VERALHALLGAGAFMSTTSLLPCTRAAGGLPFIQPATLVALPDPFDDPDWIFEPKYDGFRGILYASSLGCEIRSARDLPLERFLGLRDRVAEVLGGREAILDGEIVALNRQGKPVYENLVRGRGFLAYAAVDLVWLDGQDLRDLPLVERKAQLARLLPEDTGPLYKILAIEEHGRALFGASKRLDLEGIVAKRKDGTYRVGTTWYKIGNPGYSRRIGRSEPSSRSATAR
jgi:bifunctional non-homologous end joining protein LigD